MEGGGTAAQLVWFIVVASMLASGVCRQPVRHLVGGKNGWIPNFNYTPWSLNETFYVDDWLYFVFDKHMYNVLEVNETSYEQCNDQAFITNITRGGRDVFELTQPRPYYFLSSGGYCYNGMKLSINVVEYVLPPQLSPNKNGCTHNSIFSVTLTTVVLALILIVSVSKLY